MVIVMNSGIAYSRVLLVLNLMYSAIYLSLSNCVNMVVKSLKIAINGYHTYACGRKRKEKECYELCSFTH